MSTSRPDGSHEPGKSQFQQDPTRIASDGDSIMSAHSQAETRTANRRTLSRAHFDDEDRFQTMVKYMFGRINVHQWSNQSRYVDFDDCDGVLLRKSRGSYVCFPPSMNRNLLEMVTALNVQVAFTVRCETVDVVLSKLKPHQTSVEMINGSQLQVVDSLTKTVASTMKRFQYACLVRREKLLLVWHDDIQQVIPHAQQLEDKLLSIIWGTTLSPFATGTPVASAKNSIRLSVFDNKSNLDLPHKSFEDIAIDEVQDEEKAESGPESLNRPVYFTSAIYVGMAVCLTIILLLGLGVSQLLTEYLWDGGMVRFALVAPIPLLMLVGLFTFIVVFTNLFQAFGPIGGVLSNSRHHSAIRPSLRAAYSQGFTPPPITIQMPVYKEGLEGVIAPTVRSLKAASSHYESHGGSATIFINDDGMSVISPEDQAARKAFYFDNSIGWVARPKHNSEDGYVRKGKFKKASNMNFALNVSQKVEGYLQTAVETTRHTNNNDLITEHEEQELYATCLERVLKEDSRVQAAGNIRMGEIILIVDSDTRVPIDCLLYGAAEMFLSPEVAIVQQSTGVMQVVGDYFENGFTYFTNVIYSSITFAVGCGEVAAFVGHNAFLRWQAIQSVGEDDPDGYVAYWSESSVSEDFDIALRLQIAGDVVRCASYHGDGFKEGVSLTIYDELSRWEKYAYGCSELIFNPFKYWLFRGPFTPIFRKFLGSNLILSSKFSIMAYMCTYFAIALGGPLTLANYFLIGWFDGELDKFYLESWKVFLSLIAIYSIASSFFLAILRYRLGQKGLFPALIENLKWMPMFSIFFGGLSFHLNGAVISHLIGYDMTWGATAKEKENSNFFKEVPKIFKSFWLMYICAVLLIGGMIYLGCFAPAGWRIDKVTAIVPLAVTVADHVLLPFVLNPSLMVLSY